MIKGLVRDITLAIQAKSGVTAALVVCIVIALIAALTAFGFLCVAGYVWLSWQLGAVYAGLAAAGVFLLIAAIAAIAGVLSRRHARERAILERAARARTSSWLLDPKILGVAAQAGRALGWERIIPVALLGLLAAQWAREKRAQKSDDDR